MRRLARAALILAVASSNVTCSVNILENFADKTTNQALYVDAKKLMNAGDYDGALAKIALITGSFANNHEVIALKASAYAGRCGLVFLPFVEALGGLSSTRLFPLLMNHFRSGTTTAKIDDCTAAEGLIESIGTTAQRTNDENMLLILIAFAKIGQALSFYADSDQDGTVTNNYDVCAVGGSRAAGGDIPTSDMTEVAWSLVTAINNINAVSSSVDLGDESLSDIQAGCALLASVNAAYDFCSVTDKASFTTDHLKGVRSLIKEDQDVGLDTLQGGCDGGVATCNCP